MLSRRVFGLACAVAVFVCLVAAPVSAQPLDKRMLFTFSGPVTLPGVTLPAGQYLFRLADPNSSGKVVQVLNADGTKPYGLFFTIPAERLEPASSPEVHFMETAYDKLEVRWLHSHAVSEALIVEMAELAKQHDVGFVVANVTRPPLEKSTALNGIRIVDISVDLERPENTNLPVDPHPSAFAHSEYAQKLASVVSEYVEARDIP